MINFFKNHNNGNVRVTHTIDSGLAELMDIKITTKLMDALVDKWIEQYGAKFLKEITPKQMEKAVRHTIETNFAEKFLKDKS